jgi:hypothetical protein
MAIRKRQLFKAIRLYSGKVQRINASMQVVGILEEETLKNFNFLISEIRSKKTRYNSSMRNRK